MRRFITYGLFGVHLGIVFWFWYAGASGALLSRGYVVIPMGRLFGLLAATFVLMQFLLVGRNPFMERAFGLDTLTRIHHWNGFLTLFFIVLHPFFITFGYARTEMVGFFSQLFDFFLNYEDVFQAFLAFILFLGIVIFSVAIVRKKFKYETWYFVHLGMYLAVVLAFGHQLHVGEDFVHSKVFSYYWYFVYVFVFGNLALWRFVRPLYLFYRHRFFVSRIVRETNETTSIYISGMNIERFRIRPGQFMIFRFLAKKFFWQAHPFSLSYVPKNNELRISVKKRGDFTADIQGVVAGTPVLIDGPYGIFTSEVARRAKFLFVAGGIGITPIRAMLEEIGGRGEDAVLVYNNRTPKDIVFHNELDELSQKYRIRVYHVMSEDVNWPGLRGKITMPLLRELVPDFLEREIYLCGPGKMMKSLRSGFVGDGVERSAIHYELFSLQ